ncbi:exported hypothetical protein [Candidatus Sulfopaludibacter sp. SbA3]|nr:exported hypothetical protein [Candidatus Sulfopaludibacter sp. SbA3]
MRPPPALVNNSCFMAAPSAIASTNGSTEERSTSSGARSDSKVATPPTSVREYKAVFRASDDAEELTRSSIFTDRFKKACARASRAFPAGCPRECKLGCVFTQKFVDHEGCAIRDAESTTYVGAIEPAEEFRYRMYSEAWRRGWEWAKLRVVLGDGAVWILESGRPSLPRRHSNRRSLSCSGTLVGDRRAASPQ